ncbi:MAG: A/G-specific adenine glycosylase [Candidatus Paceibacterota bacterium]
MRTPSTDATFISRVLDHHTKTGRHELAWRKKITPYRILVSEIMLQQTQVARVESKFALWMKAYPTLSKLSQASLTDVLKLWQGLGYQRRAKALYTLAQTTNVIPKTYNELLTLQGVGPYTASAICAFAYDIFPSHLLETNIRTALIEEFHQGELKINDGVLYDDLHRLTGNKAVQKVGAREWYYALMDYGAHLKTQKISHNIKSAHYTKQSPYEGSTRQLRAKVLFAITHKKPLPQDERLSAVLDQLLQEGYIVRKGSKFIVA